MFIEFIATPILGLQFTSMQTKFDKYIPDN